MHQMTIFEYAYQNDLPTFNWCKNCKKAKYKERSGNIDLWWCNDTKEYLTEKCFDWICEKKKGHSLYERR